MGVARRYRLLTPEVAATLPTTAVCDHWREDLLAHPHRPGSAPTSWARATTAEWGHCGVVAVHQERVVAHLVLAPAHLVPAAGPYANSPVGPDAAVLLAVHVAAGWTGHGIGRQLVQAVAADLTGRDVAALEAVGSPVVVSDQHTRPAPPTMPARYTMPAGWLDAVGFRLARDHPLTPRYRLDLGSTLRWRPDLAAVWTQVRSLVRRPVPPEPAGYAPAERSAGDPERGAARAPVASERSLDARQPYRC